MKTESFSLLNGRRPLALLSAVVAGAVLLSPGWSVQRCAAAYTTIPPLPNDEVTTSFGAFVVQVHPNFTNLFAPNPSTGFYYPGFNPVDGTLTSPVGYDGSTTIGVSANRNYVSPGVIAPPFGAPNVIVGGPSMTPPINTIGSMIDYYGVPFDFVFPPIAAPDEVFTGISKFNLTVSSGSFFCGDQRVPGAPANFDLITAGPNAGPAPYPGNVTAQGLRSIGMVQQYLITGDYPGKSFFNIFINAFLPGVSGTYTATVFPNPAPWPVAYPYTFGIAQLTNDMTDPLIIEDTNVMSLPPHVIYIHGQTPAVPVHFKYNNLPYWNAGDLFGYLTLAGHGVLECTNHGTPFNGQGDTQCCNVVTMLLDEVLGPIGSPKPPMAVPWSRSSNGFPSPGTGMHTVRSLVRDTSTGLTNDLSDTALYQFGASTVAVSDVNLGPFLSSISPPAALSAATYNNTNVGVSFKLSFSGSTFQMAGTGTVSMVLSNTGLPSTTLQYANPPAGLASYTVQITSFSARCVGTPGVFFLSVDPLVDNTSVGVETIRPSSGGFDISFYDDAHFRLSTDGINWMNANSNKTMRLLTTSVPATKPVLTLPTIAIASVTTSNLVLIWNEGATLQSATSILGPWSSLTPSNTFAPYPTPITGTQRFFRLKLP